MRANWSEKKVSERSMFPRLSSFAIFLHKIFPHPGPSLDDVSSPHMVIISPLRLYEDVVTSHWLMPETMPQHMSSLKINVSQADYVDHNFK